MLIKLEKISKDYIDDGLTTPALRDISFEIKKGEFAAIMGASGSGKSTLMHIIGFLDRPSSGEYFFDGENIVGFDDSRLAEIRNLKVGFVFQAYNLLPRTSVLDNVLLPAVYTANADKEEVNKRALSLLEKVGLSNRLSHLPNQLSGGEKQRAAIVRALINQPLLILADEPTGNLDSKSGQEVMKILQDLNEEGNTILMVTHERYVAECAKRIIMMRDGRLVSDQIVDNRRSAKEGIEK